MAVEHIDENDTLNAGRVKINAAIDQSNDAIEKATIAETSASQAMTFANEAKTQAQSTQAQLDNIIIENGQSDAEVVQARTKADGTTFPLLKDRLNDFDDKIGILSRKARNAWVDIIEDYGASPTKSASENTTAIQAAIDDIGNAGGGVVWIPFGKFNYNELKIEKPNVKIWGVGTLNNGKITIGHPTIIQDMYFEIEGIYLENDSLVDGKNGIELQNARIGRISCHFKNMDKAIYVKPVNTATNQHTNKITIERCTFKNTNYNLYIDRYADNGVWAVGDITFVNNNPCLAFKYHVYGLSVDGFTSGGNVYFFPSYNDKSQIKMNNIYLDYCKWVTIGNGDKLFEAGEEAIVIRRFENVNIIGANIAWPGQKKISSGIKFEVGGHSVARRGVFNITGNIISFPTKHGIELLDETGFGTVSANTVREPGKPDFYYGDGVKDSATLQAELDAITHYGIYTDSTTSYIEVTGNQTGSKTNLIQGIENHYSNNMEYGRVVPQQNRVLQHFSGSSVDITSYEELQLRSTSPVTITDITGGWNGQILTLIAYNSNTTIKHDNAKIRLKGSVDANPPKDGTLTLRMSNGVWYEIGRSF